VRLFIGLFPSDEERQRLMATLNQAGIEDLPAYHDPKDWHVTLAFLGQVSEETLQAGIKILNNCDFGNIGAINWVPKSFGGFPNSLNPKVWAIEGPAEPSLQALFEAIWQCDFVRQNGHKPAEFRPHMSLSRSRNPKVILPIDIGPVRFDEVCLVSSDLEGRGPRYRIIKAWPLEAC